MSKMRDQLVALTAAAALSALAANAAQAAYLEMPGNLLPSSSVAVTNGGYSGGEAMTSNLVDADLNTYNVSGTANPAWNWPMESVNVGIVHGSLANATPFGQAMNTFRIYASTSEGFPWGNWFEYPSQLRIEYSTATGAAGFDNFYNWSWDASAVPNSATILTVNGVAAPAVDANGNVPLGTGPSDTLFTLGSDLTSSDPAHLAVRYIEVTTTDIPADATAIGFLFGPAGTGGLVINQIEGAAVPEPASLGVIGLAAAGLLARRRA